MLNMTSSPRASANLAAVFQVFEGLQKTPEIIKARARLHVAASQTQCLCKENMAYHSQSSHHSTRPHEGEEEVSQNDLCPELNRQDLRPRINNHHPECDTAER